GMKLDLLAWSGAPPDPTRFYAEHTALGELAPDRFALIASRAGQPAAARGMLEWIRELAGELGFRGGALLTADGAALPAFDAHQLLRAVDDVLDRALRDRTLEHLTLRHEPLPL